MSPKAEQKIRRSLSMHTGINTGLVLTGQLYKDGPGVLGDTINLASQLCDLARQGTIYVTDETFKLTGGLFEFEALGERKIQRDKPVLVYKVLSAMDAYRPRLGSERMIYSEMLGRAMNYMAGGSGKKPSMAEAPLLTLSDAGIGKSSLWLN
jgi:hypothetical protein